MALDYEIPKKNPRNWRRELQDFFLVLPGFAMALGGLCCCYGAAFLGDSPNVKHGPLFYTCFALSALTSPVGFATVLLSLRLAKTRGRRWLWLNWAVPVFHFGSVYILMQFLFPK
jgi:hypothetical protein